MARSSELSSILPGEATLLSKSLETDHAVRPQIVITPPRRAVDVSQPSEKPPRTPSVDDLDRSPAGNLQLPGAFPKNELSDPENEGACPQSSSVSQDQGRELEQLHRRPSYSSQRSRRSDGSSRGDSDVTEQHSKNSQGIKRRSSFTVARVSMDTTKSSLDRVSFADGVESVMQLYLEDYCEDGPSMIDRAGRTLVVLFGLLVIVSTLSFWSVMIPFEPLTAGFWPNWQFNFVAAPSMMYVVSRSGVILLFRSISPAERPRMSWKSLWLPFIGPVVCMVINTIAGTQGLYPLPYIILTAAIPGQMATLIVAGLSIPADLMTTEVHKWWIYLIFGFVAYPSQLMLFPLWLAVFPKLTEMLQVLGSFALNGLLAVAAIINERVGLWLDLPAYLLYEVKVMILFVPFLYTAAMLSSAKSMTVLALMLAQDAAKAVAIFVKMCFHLLGIVEKEYIGENDALTSAARCCRCSCLQSLLVTPSELLALCQRKWSLMLEVQDRLSDIFTILQLHTRNSLQEADLALADVRLLAGFTRCIVVFGLVELCEVLVPLLYMILATMLHSPLGANREYINLFNDMELGPALVGNVFGFLIEGLVLLLLQCAFSRLIGFNLLNFAAHVLRTEPVSENVEAFVFFFFSSLPPTAC